MKEYIQNVSITKMPSAIEVLEKEKLLLEKCLNEWETKEYPEAKKQRERTLWEISKAIDILKSDNIKCSSKQSNESKHSLWIESNKGLVRIAEDKKVYNLKDEQIGLARYEGYKLFIDWIN